VQILSVNIGKSRPVSIKHKQVHTGIYKLPASEPVFISRLGLQGDELVEPRKMGLEHHAVYAYPYEHYAYWQNELQREPFPMGQFGENLTVTGLLEEEVRIGDIFRFGDTVLQVAQPRIPCAKLNERMGMHFSTMFLASRKVGYYLRVLEEGNVAKGDSIELLERDMNSPTMEEFVRVTQFEYWNAQALQYLLQARDLMPAWREIIEEKLMRAETAKGWNGLREFSIVRREQECEDTVSLYLQCIRNRPLAPFHGGQFLQVVLKGHGSQQNRRAYGLSGNPQDLTSYRITVRRVPAPEDTLPDGVVSSFLVDLKVGEHIKCTAPMGNLMLCQKTESIDHLPVLLSHGLGIAPTLSLLYELEARNASEVYLFHEQTDNDPQQLMQEVHTLLERNPDFHMITLVPGESGHIDPQLIDRHASLANADIHLAGPRSFCSQLVKELKAAGVSTSALTVQDFG